MRLPALVAGAIALAGLAACFAMAPWASPPPLTYETVSGWPMRVYYRNHGQGPERLSAVGGLPAVSLDEPLPQEAIDSYFAAVRSQLKKSPTLVKSGDFAWFEIDDPDRLAWVESQTPDRKTWFYVFAIVEMPRSSVLNDRWVSELCLVAETGQQFKRCDAHNDIRAGSS